MMSRLTRRVASFCAGLALAIGWSFSPAFAEDKATGDPYPLTTCPVSGKTLDDGAVAKTIDGREVKFCCGGCPAKFEGDKAAASAKLDEAIREKQKNVAPAVCPVSGKKLAEGEGVSKVEGNRLVRFCCDGCPAKYEADPAAFKAKLDDAVIEAQKDSYPLDTCVVSGEKLGSMGDSENVVVNNHLVRLCCKGCEKQLLKNPAKFTAKLDEAAKAKS